jgi:hypothetical protein
MLDPAVIVRLRIDEEDQHIADQIPRAKVLTYPEDYSKLRRLLRAWAAPVRARRSPRHARSQSRERLWFEKGVTAAPLERPKITVAYPETIAPACWSTVEVFLYLGDYRELVETTIRRLREREALDFSSVSSEFPRSLPVGCPVRISLQSHSLRVNPSELTINWYEPYNRLPFRISPVDYTKEGYSASLDLDVFADDLPVASLRLAIAVNSNVRSKHATSIESDAAWYEEIFASYAREDLELVKHLKERYEALGLHMFIDVDDIRSGELWQKTIFKKIDSSDLFQLFWSDNARASEFVTCEWKHALRARNIKGGHFIRSFYWQEPIAPIPRALKSTNFRKISFGWEKKRQQDSPSSSAKD